MKTVELYERQIDALKKVFEDHFSGVVSVIDGYDDLRVLVAIEYLIKREEKEHGN